MARGCKCGFPHGVEPHGIEFTITDNGHGQTITQGEPPRWSTTQLPRKPPPQTAKTVKMPDELIERIERQRVRFEREHGAPWTTAETIRLLLDVALIREEEMDDD
jgi:hypothetical protein